MHLQYKIAEEYSEKMRRYPADIPTAYSGDYGNEWVHLVLTYVIQVSSAWTCVQSSLKPPLNKLLL